MTTMTAVLGRSASSLIVAPSASVRSAGAEGHAQRPPRSAHPMVAAARRACVAADALDYVPRCPGRSPDDRKPQCFRWLRLFFARQKMGSGGLVWGPLEGGQPFDFYFVVLFALRIGFAF